MAFNWRDQAGRVGLIDRDVPSPSADALERGAARRRQGRPAIRPLAPLVEAPPPEPPLDLECALPALDSGEPPTETIADDSVWRAGVEADLAAALAAVARLDADRVAASQALRAAVDTWSDANLPDRSAEQVASIQARLDQLERAIEAVGARFPGADADAAPVVGSIAADNDQIGPLERTIAELGEQQETMAATLSAVWERLLAERVRTTALILAGTAVTLIFTTLWLLTNTVVR